jgi:Fur family peroxide stress response transcriptional regulator
MADTEKRLADIVTKLKTRGYRITPQRLEVVRILASSGGHPSIEAIYDQVKKTFPTTSIATVYKTVSVMKELGEVLELGFSDGGNRYDGKRPFPHPHLICLTCKKIIDPDLSTLSELTQELIADTNFQVETYRIDFFGICPECRERKP